ncbi:MAG: CDGSH iron-sulfur domain-containing protein [Planctomycetota bacterium]
MTDPKIPQRSPIVQDVQPGTYAWCSCGGSKNQPFCDGSHKGTAFTPIVEKIATSRKVAWCACKHSGKKPFCDGAHKNLPN